MNNYRLLSALMKMLLLDSTHLSIHLRHICVIDWDGLCEASTLCTYDRRNGDFIITCSELI